ncbi:MAG: CDP-alcohol phosphatidyltransferase family protein [Alphaproteobacteria bacterium]|nr:CDP-alcohol phosphatidyltransferase family protein [Alphaproteobacteria bacterium SS10]
MPSLYDIKPAFQRFLQPVLDACIAWRISANALTALALGLSIAGGAMLWVSGGAAWALLCYLPLLFLRMALNALDGLVARQTGTSSRAGMIFNEVADITSDVAMYVPFLAVIGVDYVALLAAVLTGVVVELSGIWRLKGDGYRAYHGPLGKSDRAFAFGLLAVLLLVSLPMLLVTVYLVTLTAMHLLTIRNRLVRPVGPPPGN